MPAMSTGLMIALVAALPLSAPDANQQSYATEQAAMDAAAHSALSISTTNEVGGAIYKQGTAYHFTLGVTANAGNAVDYRVALPQGAKMVALYHTHPGTNGGADHFSPDDLKLADSMHTSMYVVVVMTDTVIGYHCQGFPLDVVPVIHEVLFLNGLEYTVRSKVDPKHWLLERNGKVFYYTTRGDEHTQMSDGSEITVT